MSCVLRANYCGDLNGNEANPIRHDGRFRVRRTTGRCRRRAKTPPGQQRVSVNGSCPVPRLHQANDRASILLTARTSHQFCSCRLKG